MDTETTYLRLKNIALKEFPDVVVSVSILKGPLTVPKNLRIFLVDDSFLEVWISGYKYSYHWQRKDGSLYRHDNAPHSKHKQITTFPKHFHDGSEGKVEKSDIDKNPPVAIKEFLKFIREKITG